MFLSRGFSFLLPLSSSLTLSLLVAVCVCHVCGVSSPVSTEEEFSASLTRGVRILPYPQKKWRGRNINPLGGGENATERFYAR